MRTYSFPSAGGSLSWLAAATAALASKVTELITTFQSLLEISVPSG